MLVPLPGRRKGYVRESRKRVNMIGALHGDVDSELTVGFD